jgi:DNA-directed RNA polymerase specialized sigma24 family protein
MNCYLSMHSSTEPSFPMERIMDRNLVRNEDGTKRLDYAMSADFCQTFQDRVDHFYTLSLLLTADSDKAEQCLVAGLEDCLRGNPVFREWAQSWARRMVIKNAIRIISPSPSRNGTGAAAAPGDMAEAFSESDSPVAAITRLQPFERFAYVLSVLEKYSDRECAMLLDSTVGEVVNARTRALQQGASAGMRISAAENAPTRVAEELKQCCGEAS